MSKCFLLKHHADYDQLNPRMCVCVCVRVCACVYMYMYMYIYVYVYVHICIHISVCIFTYVCMYVYIYIYIYIYMPPNYSSGGGQWEKKREAEVQRVSSFVKGEKQVKCKNKIVKRKERKEASQRASSFVKDFCKGKKKWIWEKNENVNMYIYTYIKEAKIIPYFLGLLTYICISNMCV